MFLMVSFVLTLQWNGFVFEELLSTL